MASILNASIQMNNDTAIEGRIENYEGTTFTDNPELLPSNGGSAEVHAYGDQINCGSFTVTFAGEGTFTVKFSYTDTEHSLTVEPNCHGNICNTHDDNIAGNTLTGRIKFYDPNK